MTFFRKLRGLSRRSQLERDLADELRAHLEMREAENQARGMTQCEAQEAARRQFGGTDQIKEIARDLPPSRRKIAVGTAGGRLGFSATSASLPPSAGGS